MSTSVASAKHAYIGPFSLLVGTYENCAHAVSYLFDDPPSLHIFIPYIKESCLLCDPYPFEDGPEKEEVAHHHAQKQSEFPWDAYPVCGCNHIPEPRGRR